MWHPGKTKTSEFQMRKGERERQEQVKVDLNKTKICEAIDQLHLLLLFIFSPPGKVF